MKYSSYRKTEIIQRLKPGGIIYLDILVVGATGAGKSTTLNTICQKTVERVGDAFESVTQRANLHMLNDKIRLWDTPGLGDGIESDKKHISTISNILAGRRVAKDPWFIRPTGPDLVLVIIDGCRRDLGSVYALVKVLLSHVGSDRILFAINKADLAMGGRHWNAESNTPDSILSDYLVKEVDTLQKRIFRETKVRIPKPICYSAACDYNITSLLDMIVDHIPTLERLLSIRHRCWR